MLGDRQNVLTHQTKKKVNLTYTQHIVMMVLWEYDALSVKAMGERLYIDSCTLTPLLKKMEAKELLQRERSARDERSVSKRSCWICFGNERDSGSFGKAVAKRR